MLHSVKNIAESEYQTWYCFDSLLVTREILLRGSRSKKEKSSLTIRHLMAKRGLLDFDFNISSLQLGGYMYYVLHFNFKRQ